MKVIGQITPEYEDSEEYGQIVTNGGYINGFIIAFSEAETNILKMLQQVVDELENTLMKIDEGLRGELDEL